MNNKSEKNPEQKKVLPIQIVLRKIKRKLNELPIGQPKFIDKRYTQRDFSTKFFHPIPNIKHQSKLSFIDGGNAPIYESPNVSIHLSRIYFKIFKNKKRINPKFLPQRMEFYTICYTIIEGSRIFYETEIVPINNDWTQYLPDVMDMKFDSFEPSLMS